MSISLYDASVESYLQVLGGIAEVMDKGKAYAAEGKMDLDEMVGYKLAEDMLPFSFQVISVWHHSLGAIKGLEAGVFSPPPPMQDITYDTLRALLETATEELSKMTPEHVNSLSGKPMMFKMGAFELPFTSDNFILSFSLPNFYFHASTTYTMLRSHGVPLGKKDFLGKMRLQQ